MTLPQAVLLVVVPVLVAGVALYTSRSPRLGALGVLVVLAGGAALATVDRALAAALGVLAVLLHAAGRAGRGGAAGDDPARRARGDVAGE